MTEVLLCYAAALALSAAGFAAILLFFKRIKRIRLRWGSFLIGAISAVVYFIALMLLFKATFSTDYYYNTMLFRSLVGFVFIALLCIGRLLLTKAIFFSRYKEQQGLSFCLGFGAAPGAFIVAYLLIILPVVAINGIFNGPCIVEGEGYLSFADNTIISVFRPAAGHISFAVLAICFAVMTVASGFVLQKISERPYPLGVAAGWVVFMAVLEVIAVLPVPFISMYGLAHWQLALIGGAVAAVSVLLARFMPKERKPADYSKQFE